MRSQCYFQLSELVNERLMAINVTKFKTNIDGYTLEDALSEIYEELDAVKKTDNSDDGKNAIIPKSEMKEQLGRSPDFSDVLMMRQFFDLQDEEVVTENYYSNSGGYHAPKINKAR